MALTTCRTCDSLIEVASDPRTRYRDPREFVAFVIARLAMFRTCLFSQNSSFCGSARNFDGRLPRGMKSRRFSIFVSFAELHAQLHSFNTFLPPRLAPKRQNVSRDSVVRSRQASIIRACDQSSETNKQPHSHTHDAARFPGRCRSSFTSARLQIERSERACWPS